MSDLSLQAWANLAGVAAPDAPPLARTRTHAREQAAPPRQIGLGLTTSSRRRRERSPSPQNAEQHGASTASSSARRARAWTLSSWLDDGAGLVRWWLPDGHDAPRRVAACVEPDDLTEGWTVTVLQPQGRQGDRVAWWTGGGFVALEQADPESLPVEGEQRVRRADGRLLRVKEVPLPHRRTLEAALAMADRSLERMVAKWGRGA